MLSGDGSQSKELEVHRQESILSFASPALAVKDIHLKSPLCWNEEAATTMASSNASKMTTSAKQRASSPHFINHASPDYFKGMFEDGELGESRHQKSNRIVDDLSPFKDWTGASDRDIMRVKAFDECMSDEEELRMIDDNEVQSSTDSGFEHAEPLMMGRNLAKEFDRFIP